MRLRDKPYASTQSRGSVLWGFQDQQHLVLTDDHRCHPKLLKILGSCAKKGDGWECNVLLLWLDFLSSSVLLRLTVEGVPSMNVVSWRLKNKLSLPQILILLGGWGYPLLLSVQHKFS